MLGNASVLALPLNFSTLREAAVRSEKGGLNQFGSVHPFVRGVVGINERLN